jgi:hypothetical protein
MRGAGKIKQEYDGRIKTVTSNTMNGMTQSNTTNKMTIVFLYGFSVDYRTWTK